MQMILNGKHADSSDRQTLEVTNPYDGKLLDTVPAATKEDVDYAIRAAVAAQKQWAKVSVYERTEIVKRFAALMSDHIDRLAQLLTSEVGKPIMGARSETANLRSIFLSFAEKARHIYGDVIPPGCEHGTKNTMLLAVREPLGVIACVTPFNFPCWSFANKVAPAIIAGNAVIVKPSSDAPLTICALVELMVEAGFPDGVIQVVTGKGSTVGTWLCENEQTHGITLTGSTEVGIQTARAGASHLAHVTLELGGNDAFILLEDADMELALDQVIAGRMSNNGQVCCSPKRFLIHNHVREAFTEQVIQKIAALKRGNPADPESQVSCLISERAATEVEAQVNRTVAQGARVALGGKRDGTYYAPTVLTGVTREMDVAKDMEIFGPVVPIIGIDSLDEALDIANASSYGLGGCIFTRDMKRAFQAAQDMRCGCVVINGSSFFSTMEMGFGGYKHSGIGREGVISSFDDVTQMKTIALKNLF